MPGYAMYISAGVSVHTVTSVRSSTTNSTGFVRDGTNNLPVAETTTTAPITAKAAAYDTYWAISPAQIGATTPPMSDIIWNTARTGPPRAVDPTTSATAACWAGLMSPEPTPGSAADRKSVG